ncbi:MAG TPA: 3-hydroxyacyl-CoA dehydrogenase NAD-binding domain-containing protein, partial [Actinomycetes bacterium]|nr:3-hydroxyacyl-CoA dehydrogenase NAD-binding domain-containing protein [Actinomycetes bacterium]
GHRVFRRLGDADVPTFAFTNGLAIGGGVEIGLHCNYRTVISSLPALGLSECYLGLVPGWGGAWLLPNLVGAEAAVTVMVENPLNSNTLLRAPEVMALGLADAVFDGADFLAQSLRWAATVVTGETVVARAEPDRGAAWDAALARGRAIADVKTGGAAPAPYRALALIEAARTSSRDEGFAAEDEALADLLLTDEMRAGVYTLDLVTKRAKRPAGAPRPTLARPVTKVGIVGAGLMASQIALLLARRLQVPVVLTDVDQARVDHGVAAVHAEIATLARKGRIRPDAANRLTALVTGSVSHDGFTDADLVIEAVFERLDVKKAVFAELESVVRPDCVLATNTSSLSVSAMAAGLAHPERVVGLHFFNPVAVMPFLEVVRAEATDDASLATAFAVAKELKKTAVLVKDSPAFVVNRLLGRWMGEVSRIVDEGTPLPVADGAFAGLAPMPPFMLLGLVGPAVALHTAVTLHDAFPERFYVSANLRRVVDAGKTAIYTFVDGKPVVDPEVAALFETPAEPVELTREQVRHRVLAALAEEAQIMLDDGVVAEPADIDLGLITGAGFSPWNGGLTPLLDRTGIAEQVTGRRFLPEGVASVACEH